MPSCYRLVAADLSLKRPGFCIMHISKEHDVIQMTDIELYSIDNKTKKKPRGQLLSEIAEAFRLIIDDDDKQPTFYVREKSVNNCGFSARSGALARSGISEVVGVIDYIAWMHQNEFDEIYPVTIKKLVAGNGRADKKQVAEALFKYIGNLKYKNDDESDAAAVAVAWLIQNGEIESKGADSNE